MEKTKYKCIDQEHNTYQCEACGHIVTLEADGPFENGMDFCAHCGRVIEHETFTCLCGYEGKPAQIIYEIPATFVNPVADVKHHLKMLGFICCPKCGTVKVPMKARRPE